MRLILSATVLCCSFLFPHADAAYKTGKQVQTLVRAMRIWDAESGAYSAATEILIREGVIVKTGNSLPVSEGTYVIDLSEYTVLPGLIDANSHLLRTDKELGAFPKKELLKQVRLGTTLRALQAVPRAADYLRQGFTTVRDLGNSGWFGDVALKSSINGGVHLGPRMIVSGPALTRGHGMLADDTPASLVAQEYQVISGPESARAAVRSNIEQGVAWITVLADNFPNKDEMSFEELKAVVDEAHKNGILVAAHATSDSAVRNAVMAGVNSIEPGRADPERELAVETLQLMADRKVTFVPSDFERKIQIQILQHLRPGHPGNLARVSQIGSASTNRLLTALKLGVPVVAGSDMYLDLAELGLTTGQGAKHSLYAYVDEGITPVQALQMATVNGARLLGLEGKVGVLKQGAFADLIAVKGDPTLNIRDLESVYLVMKDGVVAK